MEQRPPRLNAFLSFFWQNRREAQEQNRVNVVNDTIIPACTLVYKNMRIGIREAICNKKYKPETRTLTQAILNRVTYIT